MPTGLQRPLRPSAALAAIVGNELLSRTEATKRLWDYIRKQGLQNPGNRREILADAKLEAVVDTKTIDMLELPGALSKHLAAP